MNIHEFTLIRVNTQFKLNARTTRVENARETRIHRTNTWAVVYIFLMFCTLNNSNNLYYVALKNYTKQYRNQALIKPNKLAHL